SDAQNLECHEQRVRAVAGGYDVRDVHGAAKCCFEVGDLLSADKVEAFDSVVDRLIELTLQGLVLCLKIDERYAHAARFLCKMRKRRETTIGLQSGIERIHISNSSREDR